MSNRRTLNISLTPRLQRFVGSRVASGRYQSASEVVREGLRLLEQEDLARKTALDEIRKRIDSLFLDIQA